MISLTSFFVLEWKKMLREFIELKIDKSIFYGKNGYFCCNHWSNSLHRHLFLHSLDEFLWFGKIDYADLCLALPFSEILKMYDDEKHKSNVNWLSVIKNHRITIEMIVENQHLPWRLDAIYENPNITFKHILKYPNIFNDWMQISSMDEVITIDDIVNNLNKPWNFRVLSNWIDIKHIEKHIDLPWNWSEIDCNPTLTIDFVYAHPDKNWCWRNIFNEDYKNMYICYCNYYNYHGNENIFKTYDEETLKKFQKIFEHSLSNIMGRDEDVIYKYKYLTFNLILKNLHLPWNWVKVTKHKCITINIIKNNPNLPWKYDALLDKDWWINGNQYIKSQQMKLFMLSIHESYENTNGYEEWKIIDLIFADNYLMKNIGMFL